MTAQVFIPKDTTAVALGADGLALKMAQNIELVMSKPKDIKESQ